MIPVKLTIQGLYSYQEAVEIDFRHLTAAQLFGIFGPVGSGKSSILEAMTLALYGESARLNKNDKRSTNMLNLRSERLFVDFTFLDRQSRTFRFTAEAKRNRKRPEEVGNMNRRAYRLDARPDSRRDAHVDARPDSRRDPSSNAQPNSEANSEPHSPSAEWIPLDHNDGERVLGLSYQNFRRTTIIPQGRFQEFLQLGATDRTEMMKELFQLERFDLHSRTRTLMGATTTHLEGVESALRELPEDPEAIRTELRAEAERVSSERATAGARRTEANVRAEQLARLTALHRELAQLQQQDRELRSGEHALKELEAHITRLHEARDHLRGPFERLQDARRRVEEAQGRLREIDERLEPAQQRLRELEERRNTLESDAQRRPVLEALREALSRGAQRVSVEQEIHEKREARDAAVKLREDSQRQIGEFRSALAELEAGIPERRRLGELQSAVQAEQYYRTAADSIASRRTAALQQAGLTAEASQAELAELREQAERDRRHLEAQLRRAAVDDQLRELAESLSDGEPCPVCGSLHHPGGPHAAADSGGADGPAAGAGTRVGADAPAGASSPAGDVAALEAQLSAVAARVSQLTELQGTLSGLAAEEQALEPPAEVAGRQDLPQDPTAAVTWLQEVEARYTQIDARRATLEQLQSVLSQAESAVAGEEARVEEGLRRREERVHEESSILEQLDQEACGRYEAVLGESALPAGQGSGGAPAEDGASTPATSGADTAGRTARRPGTAALAAAATAAAEEVSQELDRLQSELQGLGEQHAAAAQEVERLAAQREERRQVLTAATDELHAAELAFAQARSAAPHVPQDSGEAAIAELLNDLPELSRYEEQLTTARERRRRIAERTAEITRELAAGEGEAPADPAELDDELASLRGEITQLDQRISTLGEQVGAINSRIETVQAQIFRRDQLTAEREALQTRRDNLTTLLNLFRGAGFVSYVAQ
ncbi:MAG: AAA family ATPase, partial [Alkalispirochaeta sp.]